MTSRRDFLATGAAFAAQQPPRKPNIILVLADDMGFSDAGCYGGEIATPTLDGLASGGLRFTQMYSTARCWPSRSCLMTGYYPQQVGRDKTNGYFPRWARLAPQYLKPAGYRTYHSGKWHVTGKWPVKDAQFDRSYYLGSQFGFFSAREHYLDDQPLPNLASDSGYYTTKEVANRAIDFLSAHPKEDPYFLYLCFTAPHFPLHALPEDIAAQRGRYDEGWDVIRNRRYQRLRQQRIVNHSLPSLDPTYFPHWNLSEADLLSKLGPGEVGRAVPWKSLNAAQRRFQARKMEIHAAMIARMDIELARVLAQAKQAGDWDNTLVIFLSDNGASAEIMVRGDGHDQQAPMGSAATHLCLGPGWSSAANTPFRLHKYWNHEGGISSPAIFHWPAAIKSRGALRHNPCHFTDMLPTFLDLAQASPAMQHNNLTPPKFPGQSLRPLFEKDGALPHDYIYFRHEDNRGLRQGNWKIVAAGENAAWELYDLSEDRGESRNLAAKLPERLNQLKSLWEKQDRQWTTDNAIGKP
jgi:arylsulfatase A-like enzyme